MAFDRDTVVQPVSIGDISVELFSPAVGSTEQASIMGRFQVVMSDSSIRVKSINLAEHLTPQRLTSLQTLMADLRTKAETEILPE